jgi:hypothetical protein
MGNTRREIADSAARAASTPPDGDPTNPELIKVLRAEEILAQTPPAATEGRDEIRGAQLPTDAPAHSAPASPAR